ncbi:hypothetical protein GWK47_039811 [Chionoecetes opilio]|uniref:Uncharacterized protein n=1 Tax=Chionoecetes opilio TaxID=41210 RepID=A0A8J4YJ21_CHIOP|nr:hypothetical protein GWK47_039811 [Chionoecetes opilio]
MRELLRLCLLFPRRKRGTDPIPSFPVPPAKQGGWQGHIRLSRCPLFADQLELPARIQRGLRQVALLSASVHQTLARGTDSGVRSKERSGVLQALNEYPDKEVGRRGYQGSFSPPWYLSEDLIALGFLRRQSRRWGGKNGCGEPGKACVQEGI